MYRTNAGKAGESETGDAAIRPIQLTVRPRGLPIKHLPKETYALPTDSCKDIYDRISAKSRTPINRIRITRESDGEHIPNKQDLTVDAMGLYEGVSIQVKDLGPQIAWRTVFLIEYFGPILIHPLVYLLRPFLYRHYGGSVPPASNAQLLSLTLIVLHFIKREFETVFIHRFSNATMPVFNIFKNSAHYWLLAGLNVALCTYSPHAPTQTAAPYSWWNAVAIVLFIVGELGNLSAHITLMNLRSAGGSERGIPRGGVFSFIPVTCPNYFFETVAWIGMWMSNRSWSTAIFIAVAVGQMALWAKKKESRYRREFGDKYRRRRFSMIPGIW